MAIFEYDQRVVDDLISRFGLRPPNAKGLDAVVHALSRQDECEQVVLDIATGVGKTWLLAALLEYAAASGIRNLLVVLPGKTVRTKTIANFTPGAQGFVEGAEIEKHVITPQNFTENAPVITDPDAVKLFLMNVHHLVAEDTDDYVEPGKAKSQNLRTARPQEQLGGPLLDYLSRVDDLLVVLDESHRFTGSAATWSKALERLEPAARVGLTATPERGDNVIYKYHLHKAIADKFVKTPVLARRTNGYRDNEVVGQLRDAKKLLQKKAASYRDHELRHPDAKPINPIMLVTCQDTEHADEIAGLLTSNDLFAEEQVLTVHSNAASDAMEAKLAQVQEPDSPVRVIVQVSMLNEGWNVHNVAVLVPLRALESGTLTEQLIGRGLRLPYGEYTGDEWVDSLDILSHKAVVQALKKHGISGSIRATEDIPSHSSSGAPAANTASVPAALGDPGALGDDVFWLTDDSAYAAASDDPELAAVAALSGGTRDIETLVTTLVEVEPEREKVLLLDESTFKFPLATFETEPHQLRLVDLDDEWHKKVAATIGDDFTDQIDRETIIFTDQKGVIKFETATQAELFDDPMTAEIVQDNLETHLRKLGALKNGAAGAENRRAAIAFVRRFVSFVEGEWTVRRAGVAVQRLKDAVNVAADEAAKQSREIPKVHPLTLPRRKSTELPVGVKIKPQSDVDGSPQFTRGQNYDGWRKGRYSASSFDSYSAEFQVAKLLDVAEQITWWMRLETTDGARIEYGAGRSYYPDFVALDKDGVHWIIEGKDERGRQDETVQAKRAAAERVLRVMESDPTWADVRWGYLIAYEGDVKTANSWSNLRNMSDATTMLR
ncbi:DEAD/DEAH box helicase family protein [Leucobacter salsicius]|uniref:DEAD/DEAH box helicase family protein n=1 Tax=Leucobacter salsicius TaxID=664638 RepID=UPI00034C2C2A|nr:DEAD/DEAH box helicase family protein [Leucobacter salsicius]